MTRLSFALILATGLTACVDAPPPTRPLEPDLSCLDDTTATAINIENESRDSKELRPCAG